MIFFQFETKKVEMTPSIKPVGLYYEKKQPNQIETRNQFKTHDDIDRNRLFKIAIANHYHNF